MMIKKLLNWLLMVIYFTLIFLIYHLIFFIFEIVKKDTTRLGDRFEDPSWTKNNQNTQIVCVTHVVHTLFVSFGCLLSVIFLQKQVYFFIFWTSSAPTPIHFNRKNFLYAIIILFGEFAPIQLFLNSKGFFTI